MWSVSESNNSLILYKKGNHECQVSNINSSSLSEPLVGVDNAIEELSCYMSVTLSGLSKFESELRKSIIENGTQYVSQMYQEAKAKDYTKLITFQNTEEKKNLALGINIKGKQSSKNIEFNQHEDPNNFIERFLE